MTVMACHSPRIGYASRDVNPSGKRSTTFSSAKAFDDAVRKVPCRNCNGCRMGYAREKAIRCSHEASLYEHNCMLTLTYSPDHLPKFGSIVAEHPEAFMKKLRERERKRLIRFGFDKGQREQFAIRSFGVAEYGAKFQRPHYHILLFNYDFPDKEVIEVDDRGHRHYRSDLLDDLWGKGRAVINDFSFATAAYVARYCVKKVFGPRGVEHYGGYWDRSDPLRPKAVYPERQPERPVCVSLKPGIGRPFLEKYYRSIYANDSVVLNERELPVPKYYDKVMEKLDFELVEDVQFKRHRSRLENSDKLNANSTFERLRVREECLRLRLKQLKRGYEDVA